MGLAAIYRKPRTSVAEPDHPIYPYFLSTGFLYLVAITDSASRRACAELSWYPIGSTRSPRATSCITPCTADDDPARCTCSTKAIPRAWPLSLPPRSRAPSVLRLLQRLVELYRPPQALRLHNGFQPTATVCIDWCDRHGIARYYI